MSASDSVAIRLPAAPGKEAIPPLGWIQTDKSQLKGQFMIQEHLRRVASFTTAALLLVTGQSSASAADVFSPNNLVLSRSVYEGAAGTVTVGQPLPPGCVKETVTLTFVTPPPPATSP